MNNDTATFAVQTIRRWWQELGRSRYHLATWLIIAADGGGSNGSRLRLWKLELQCLATELGIEIVVRHLPPGTSKYNKIEHRLFSFTTINWQAEPLVSDRVIRQSSAHQVQHNRESQVLRYAMRDRLAQPGWSQIEVIDEDLGCSAAGGRAAALARRSPRESPPG